MDKPEFHDLLRKLHLELEHNQSIDKVSMDLLQNILTDIHHILSQKEDKYSEHHLSLNTRLNLAVHDFEDTHPNISATMKQLIDDLSNMGI